MGQNGEILWNSWILYYVFHWAKIQKQVYKYKNSCSLFFQEIKLYCTKEDSIEDAFKTVLF